MNSWWIWIIGLFVAWLIAYATVTSALNEALRAECGYIPMLEPTWEL